MKSVAAKCESRLLTEDQKQSQLNACSEVKRHLENFEGSYRLGNLV